MPSSPCRIRRCLLGALFAAPLPAFAARPLRDALPIVLAQEAPADVSPAGFLVSEKYDGVRAYWGGRQLRFRSGALIAAPAWFTQRLPARPLDGELWLGRGRFEALSAAVRRAEPVDAEWRALRYMVFELPGGADRFDQRVAQIAALVAAAAGPQVVAVPQMTLPDTAALQRRLREVVQAGGEGLMLRRADAPYVVGRSAGLLKLKPLHDAEATVIAHERGRGRHAGRLGALRVRGDDGIEFAIGTGFSDRQREAPPPLGSRVTYNHRGHTAAGVPRFASFVRVHVHAP